MSQGRSAAFMPRISFAGLVVALAIAVGGLVLTAGSALAHHVTYTANATCEQTWSALATYVGGPGWRLILIDDVVVNGVPFDPSWASGTGSEDTPPSGFPEGTTGFESVDTYPQDPPGAGSGDYVWVGAALGFTIFSRDESTGPFAPGNANWTGRIVQYEWDPDAGSSGDWVQGGGFPSSVTVTEPTGAEDCEEVTPPDLEIEKSGPASLAGGADGSYTVTARNVGDGPTTADITVSDDLPDGLTNLSLSAAGWDCDPLPAEPTSGATFECTYSGSLDTNEEASFSLDFTTPDDDCSSIVNTVSVSGGGDEGTDPDDTDSVTTDLTCEPTPTGSIRIVKDTDPETNNIEFDFDGSFPDFDLEDDQSKTFNNLAAGSYTIEEDEPSDWNLTSISCNADDYDVSLGAERVVVHLKAGEDVTCTFNNVRDPEPTSSPEPTATSTPLATQTTVPTATTEPVFVEPTQFSEELGVSTLPNAGSGGSGGAGPSTFLFGLGLGAIALAGLPVALQQLRRRPVR